MTSAVPGGDGSGLGLVHLIGIGGAGMSVIAELFAARGIPVQGSDARRSPVLDSLEAAGARVWVGHDAEHLGEARTVVVSTAVRESNPELAAARRAGLRVLHRSQALALLMAGGRSVAVAGAHGKTTTSAMVVAALQGAGLDPSYAVGSSLVTAHGPVPGGHLGADDVMVIEADESDGSFLNYRPTVALITNVEPDHLDHFGSREAFEQAFVDFAARVGDTLVACVDDPGAAALARAHRESGGQVVGYGTTPQADLRLTDLVTDGSGIAAMVHGAGQGLELRLPVPGTHNALNAAGALAAAIALGVDAQQAARGLAEFRGTGRRFEYKGAAGGVRVVDDYAHHPTEVAALVGAARAVAGDGRVLIVFQPHLYSRTRTFAREFAQALDAADLAVVSDIYAAREDPDPTVGPDLIVDQMVPGRGRAVPDRMQAALAVADAAGAGDLVLTVGAGDVTELGAVILDRLASRAN